MLCPPPALFCVQSTVSQLTKQLDAERTQRECAGRAGVPSRPEGSVGSGSAIAMRSAIPTACPACCSRPIPLTRTRTHTSPPSCPPPPAAGDTLRETILLLEREVSTMEQRMNAAKTEASTLKKKLEEVSAWCCGWRRGLEAGPEARGASARAASCGIASGPEVCALTAQCDYSAPALTRCPFRVSSHASASAPCRSRCRCPASAPP